MYLELVVEKSSVKAQPLCDLLVLSDIPVPGHKIGWLPGGIKSAAYS
jgi:hypothetical protein